MKELEHIELYTAVGRYEFYLRMVKTMFELRAQRMSKILFLPREKRNHIFKPPCNVFYLIVFLFFRQRNVVLFLSKR